MTKIKTTLFDIYGRSLEIVEADVPKAYAKAMNDHPDFDLAVAVLNRDDYETRCIPTADGRFAYMPDRLPREGLYRYAHRMKRGVYPIKITEEVFLAAFPELSQEEKARVHSIFRPGEGTLPRINKVTVQITYTGRPDLRGKQIEVVPVNKSDRDRICAMLDSEGILAPRGTRFSEEQIPPAFAHTKWLFGDWVHKNTSIRVPAPGAHELWLVDLVFHPEDGYFVAIPVSMNIPDQRRICVMPNPKFDAHAPIAESEEFVTAVEPSEKKGCQAQRIKDDFTKNFVRPLIQDAFAYLDPDVAIGLLAKELFSQTNLAKSDSTDVDARAKIASISDWMMVRPDAMSSEDVKIAVLKNTEGEWHIVDASGPVAGPFTQTEAQKVFFQK